MITEKEFKKLGFGTNRLYDEVGYYIIINRYPKIQITSIHNNFELKIESKLDSDIIFNDLKIYDIQDLKKVVKNLKELSEFMVWESWNLRRI